MREERTQGRAEALGADGAERAAHPATNLLHVTAVEFTPASESDAATGLLGWTSFRLGGQLELDSVQVRRTRGGRLALSFPGRRSRSGRLRRYVAPLTNEARGEIERQVLAELRRRGVVL